MAPPFHDFFSVWSEYKIKQREVALGAPEVVRRDVKHVCNFLNWRNCVVMLTNITNQIQNKYCCKCTQRYNFPTTASSKKCSQMLWQQPTTGNSNMAAQTGSTYISGTMIDGVEISTANLEFSTVASSKKVLPNDSHNDQQPEVAIWSPKSGMLIALATL